MADWHIQGQYMATCNCDFICPCIGSNLTARPPEGDCKAAIAMRIDDGNKDGTSLDGLAFTVLLHSPGPMAEPHYRRPGRRGTDPGHPPDRLGRRGRPHGGASAAGR